MFSRNALSASIASKVLVLALAISCYFFALGFRLPDISSDDIGPDELHWIERSSEVLIKFEKGLYSRLTTHLEHPGIPPALIMATSFSLFKDHLGTQNKKGEKSFYVDRLTVARTSLAFISSLIFPILFLFLRSWFGLLPAFLVSLLFAVDPVGISLGREAHVDAILTLFIVTTVLLYIEAENRGKPWIKLLAGVFWGLAIATKVTAVALVAGLVCYRFVLWSWSFFRKPQVKYDLIRWEDIAAIIIGHVILGFLYTRLWAHEYGVLAMKGVHSKLADMSYGFGLWLNGSESYGAYATLAISIIGAFFAAHYLIRNKIQTQNRKSTLYDWVGIVALFVFSIILIHALFPALIENFIRLYTRIDQLKGMGHFAYGTFHKVSKGGYLVLYLTRLPDLVLLGIALFILSMFSSSMRKSLCENKKLSRNLFYVSVIAFVWTLILGVSSKQTIRYVLPIEFVFYLFSVIGWVSVISILSAKVQQILLRYFRRSFPFTGYIALLLLIVLQVTIVTQWFPYYQTYYNYISGDLRAANKRGVSLIEIGQAHAVHFIDSLTKRGNFTQRPISIIGDLELFSKTASRMNRNADFPIKFKEQRGPAQGKYVLVNWSFYRNMDPIYRQKIMSTDFLDGKKIYEFSFRGVPINTLYSFAFASLETPITYNFSDMPHLTGQYAHYNGTKPGNDETAEMVKIAIPEKHQKGFVANNFDIAMRAGHYKLSALMGIPEEIPVTQNITANRYVARIELGKTCQRIVTFGELSKKELRWIEVECENDLSRDFQFRVYWFGIAPAIFHSIRLQGVSDK